MNTFPAAPFPPPSGPPGASTLKPFTAVDLAPKGGANAAPPNPFLDNYQGPFFDRNPTAAEPAVKPAPGPAYPQEAAPAPRGLETPAQFNPPPAPPPPPAAARQSQILAANEFPAGNPGANFKPKFFLTTTAAVEGFPVQDYLGVVSVEIVVPKDLLLRNPAPYGELHRIKYAEEHVQLIKAKALEELTERATQMQADGLVGVTLQFSQFDAVVSLCSAVGTAVRVAS